MAYTGIDIGNSALKLAVCADGVIKQLAVAQIPDQLVQDGRIVSLEAMAQLIQETARANQISERKCAVVLPPSLAFSRSLTMPAMATEHLRVNLPYEFRDYITLEKDKYFYDYALLEMKRDQNGAPVEMELMAAAALKATVKDYSDMIRFAGFRLKIAIPEDFAFRNLIRAHAAAQGGGEKREYCFIDLGHTATRLHIFTGDRFEVTRVLEYGCALLDRAIAETHNVDIYVARSYKVSNYNDALHCPACAAIYERIAVEIMRALNFYAYNNPNSVLERVYFCGGGARIAPLIEAITKAVTLQVDDVATLMPRAEQDGGALALFPAAAGATQQ